MQHDYVRHLLPAYALGELAQDQSQEISNHLSRCPICRDELAQMKRVLDIATDMQQEPIADGSAAQAGQMVLETIEVQKLTPDKPLCAGKTKIIRWIIAAAVILLLIISTLIWTHLDQSSVIPESHVGAEPDVPTPPGPNQPTQGDILQMQLAQAREYFEQKNITGLLDLLGQGQQRTQIRVADYLAQLGATEALPLLNRLAKSWQGAPHDNPLAKAMESIRALASKPNEPLLSAVVEANEFSNVQAIAILDDPNWPEVTQVHVRRMLRAADGSETEGQIWIRKPNFIKDEGFSRSNQVIIDNGTDRLEINLATQEAQRSDSHYPKSSPFEKMVWGYAELFRNDQTDGEVEYQKNEVKSTDQQWVYDLYSSGDHTEKGTAWVDPKTMLLQQIDRTNDGEQSLTLIFNYDAITETLFTTELPEGMTELSPRERVMLSGQVVDQEGLPVAGAQVQASCWQAVGSRVDDLVEVTTNPQGKFQIMGPAAARSLAVPAMIWAFLNDEIAWTVLMSEGQREMIKFLEPIPGSVGSLVYSRADGPVKAVDVILVMESSESLTGLVLDADEQPIAQAKVTVEIHLTDPNGNLMPWGAYDMRLVTASTTRGEYLLQVPRLGSSCRFDMSAQAPGFVTETTTWDGQNERRLQQNLKLWRQGPTVRGTLTDNYGSPLGNRRVYARIGEKKCPGTYQTYTDAYGRFELQDCPSHPELNIQAYTSQEGLSGSAEPRVYYPDVTMPVANAVELSECQIEMIAILPELEVEVLVVDEQGHPLSGYPVSVEGNPGAISPVWREQAFFSQQTDAEGRCRFEGVPDIENLHLLLPHNLKYPQYPQAEVAIDVVDGRTEYSIRMVMEK